MLTKVYPSTIDTNLMASPGLRFEKCGIHITVKSQIRDVLWRMDYPMTQNITWCCHD